MSTKLATSTASTKLTEDKVMVIRKPDFTVKLRQTVLEVELKRSVSNELRNALVGRAVSRESLEFLLPAIKRLEVPLEDINSARLDKKGHVKVAIPQRREIVIPLEPKESKRLVKKMNALRRSMEKPASRHIGEEKETKLITEFNVATFIDNISKELLKGNWVFLGSLIEENIKVLDNLKDIASSSIDPLIVATIKAEGKMQSDIDREVVTTVKTHLVHAKTFAGIETKYYPRGREEARNHLQRAFELLQASSEIDDLSGKLGLQKLELKDLKKVDEIEGRPVYTI